MPTDELMPRVLQASSMENVLEVGQNVNSNQLPTNLDTQRVDVGGALGHDYL